MPGSTRRGPDGLSPTRGARGDRRTRCASRTAATRDEFTEVIRPALAEHGHPDRLLRGVGRSAERDRAPLPRADLPGADAARDRPRAAVPVHLEPVAEPDRAPARSGHRHRRVRAREGAQGGPAAVRRDRQGHVHPARGHHRPAPRRAVPRDGDPHATTCSGSRAMPTSRSPTRPTTCCRRSRTSCAGGASARSSGSRSAPSMDPATARAADRLARRRRDPGLRRRRPARPRRDLWQIAGIEGHSDLRQAGVDADHPSRRSARAPATTTSSRTCSRRCAPATSSSTTPTTRSPTSVERFVKQAVDDPNVLAIKMTVYRTSDDSALVPSLIEAAENGQAGGLHGGAQGPLRRAPEHPLVTRAGGGRRPRRARHPRAEDARQGDPGRPPRARAASATT